MGSCLSSSSRRCSPVSPSNFSLPPLLPSYVILSKVGKKERGSRRMEMHWSQASSSDEAVVPQGGAGLEEEGDGALHEEVGFVRVVVTITR